MRDRLLFRASLAVIAGILLSGPIAVVLVERFAPQPRFTDVETFALHYRPLQAAPYLFGFVLLAALVVFLNRAAGLVRWTPGGETRGALAEIATAMFATIVFVNYTIQVAWLPHAASAHSPFVELFAMTNPHSLCWAFEMFAYALLAVALWFVAPVLERKLTRVLIGTNVAASIGAAAAAAADPGWLLTPLGLALYAFWNALLVAIMALVAAEANPKEARQVSWWRYRSA